MLFGIGQMAVGATRIAAASTMGAVDAVRGIADAGPRRARRRVWSADGRAHVEVKGLTGNGAEHHRLREHLTGALRELKGVRWAEVNAVTQHILVDFDEEELDVETIVEVVEAAEEAHGTGEETFSRTKPEHPSADAPVNLALVSLAADAVGLSVAVAGRVLRLPAVPQVLRAPLLIAETTPRVRHLVEERIGRTHTEALFAVGNSTLNALAQGPEPILIDSTHHALRFAEARARQAVWRRRERELVGDGSALPSEVPHRLERPTPFPDGPVEKLSNRTALASLLGAGGVLATTRDPGRAGELMLATMPKAARLGREAFAATLDWELARHGVVPMDISSLRRLDRISLVAVDSSILCSDRPRILSAIATDPDTTDRQIWTAAEQALTAGDTPPFIGSGPWTVGEWCFKKPHDALDGAIGGPAALTLDVLDGDGARRGRVRIGVETDPLADALLAAARDAASHVVLTEHDSVGDLLPWADEVVAPGAPLLDYIRLMQLGDSGVLAISGHDDEALHAADVAVAVVAEGQPVCWSADLLCGPGLSQAWLVLRSVTTARQVSERSARLAMGGSALGALLAVTGRRRTTRPLTLSPVHSAMAAAIAGGTVSALRVARQSPPQPSIRGTWHDLTAREAFDRVERARREQPAEPARRGRVAAVADASRETARMLTGLPLASQTTQLAGAVIEELRDPLTPVLALGAAASAIVGSGVDALLVTGVMAGNAVISGAQRMRAEQALRRLLMGEQIMAHRVEWRPRGGVAGSAARGGAASGDTWTAGLEHAPALDVPAGELQVGDIIKLGPTDVVPADVRLLTALDLEVDESSLNGESLPVAKSTAATPGADLDERACMLYEGCTILAGTCTALVVAVGQDTEAGRAAAVAGSAPPPAGIQARLAELTRIALPAAGIGGIAVTGLSALRGVPLPRAVASGVAVAVAAVPEGLPLVATVAQLAAARRLSQRGVLVRSSRTLEALGRVDTVCFDKTGTLTQGRLSVTRLADLDGDLPLDSQEGGRLLRFAARACPVVEEGAARRLAHATDGAVVEAAHHHLGRDEKWNLISELPFETTRGYAASVGTNSTRLTLAVKGAPETILDVCTQVRSRDGSVGALTAARRRDAVAATARLTRKGLRVLAVAESHPVVDDVTDFDVASLVTGLTLIGFVAIADTPRPTSAQAVSDLSAAGVRITMITGDHPDTATAIAEQLGIPDAHLVLTGPEFDRLSKRKRAERVVQTTVFARVSPEQKVRVVQALREAGRIVAMTGDGTNDAAAIRLADVGIAIAGHGSAAARSAADLVLAEPDPSRIADALREGRTLWGNVRDAASILVGGNAGEVAFTVLGTAIAGRAPLGTRQLLLVNMLTDMLPALAVALAPARPNASEDPLAAGPVSNLWDPEFQRTLAVRGGATALGAGLAWGIGRVSGRPRRAATMGLGALVGTQLGQTLLAARHSPLVIATTAVSAVALIAVVETPGVSQFFGCTPLGPVAWGTVLASSATATAAGMVAPRLLERAGWRA